MRGDIHSVWAGRAKEYSWGLCSDSAPSNISPSDIDYWVERKNHFLFFEMKCSGSSLGYGQRLAFERLLSAIPIKSMLCIVEHQSLDKVTLPNGVIGFQLQYHDGNKIQKSDYVDGDKFTDFYAAWFEWAAGNYGAIKAVLN